MSGAEHLRGATIAFDLDGTLVDSAPDLVGTLNYLLALENIAPLPLAEARTLIGGGARRLIERGFSAQGLTLDPPKMEALFERFIDHYQSHSTELTRPYPGVVEALTHLKSQEAKLVVCTNKMTRLANPILEGLNLAGFFDAVVGADSAPAPKPDARHLITAVDLAGGDMRRTIMVGDAGPDAGVARASSVPLILVSFGYCEGPVAHLEPDVLIDHYDDLAAACARLLAG